MVASFLKLEIWCRTFISIFGDCYSMTEIEMLREEDLPKIAHELVVKYAVEKFFKKNFQQGSVGSAEKFL